MQRFGIDANHNSLFAIYELGSPSAYLGSRGQLEPRAEVAGIHFGADEAFVVLVDNLSDLLDFFYVSRISDDLRHSQREPGKIRIMRVAFDMLRHVIVAPEDDGNNEATGMISRSAKELPTSLFKFLHALEL